MRLQKISFQVVSVKCFMSLTRVFEQWFCVGKENCSRVRRYYGLVKDMSNNVRRAVLENQAPSSGNSAGLFRYYSLAAQMRFMVILYMKIEWTFSNSNYKMLLMSCFPFDMKRLKICKKMIQLFYIVCICICVCICPNVPLKRNLEKDKCLSLVISQGFLTCESKAANSSFQPSFTCAVSRLQLHSAT